MLQIYDPVRIQLLDDIVQRLIDKNVKCNAALRLDAMACITTLRNLVRDLAPPGSPAQGEVKSKVFPEEFNMIYWNEYAAAEYRKIEERKRAEASAVEWIGA